MSEVQEADLSLSSLSLTETSKTAFRSSSSNASLNQRDISEPFPAQSEARPGRLLTLPPEVLSEVLLSISGPRSALYFATLCTTLRDALEPDAIWAQWVKSYRPPQPEQSSRDSMKDVVKWHAKSSCRRCEADHGLFNHLYETVCRRCRGTVLIARLEEEGLELRSDSSLCKSYLESERPDLDHVVSTMKRMHITYTHSVCARLIDQADGFIGRRGDWLVRLSTRQACEVKGGELFDHVLTTCPVMVSSARKCKCGQPLFRKYLKRHYKRL